MSYTTILLPGKGPEGADLKVGLKFGYESYKMVVGSKNKALLFDEEGNPNSTGVAKIIYSGYLNNCIIKDTEAELVFEDFSRLVDSMLVEDQSREVLTDIIKCWSESNDIQDLIKVTSEKKSQVTPPTSTETSTESSNLPTESLVSSPGNSAVIHSES